MQFTKEAIALARNCFEAIKKISHQESACNICNGTGQDVDYKTRCKKCSGAGKVVEEWEWKPEEGKRFFFPVINSMSLPYVKEKKMAIFLCTAVTAESQGRECYLEYPMGGQLWKANKRDCIPLLHWERIEEILEGMGYWLELAKPLNKYIKKAWMKVHARIYEDIARNAAGNGKYVSCGEGKSRQEAVMRAVIELGKEVRHE